MDDIRNRQKAYRSPFFAPDFFKIVGDVREDVNVFIGEDDHGLSFYWPMHLSSFGKGRGIGGPFSDRNGPVRRSDYSLDLPAFLAGEHVHSFMTSGLTHVELPQSNILRLIQTNGSDLTQGWETFLDTQRQTYPSFYKRIRRLGRKLEKDFSEVEFRFDDRRPETFDRLIMMKRAQYKATGRHDVLNPPWVSAMFDRLHALDGEGLRTRLSSLYVDGKLAAAELNLQSHNVLHGWIVAYDTQYSKYSPGSLLTHFVLKNLEINGMTFYDSGIEGDHYKKYVSNHHSLLKTGIVTAAFKRRNMQQACGQAWRFAEKSLPGKLSSILSRTRRRSEQILATEVGARSSAKGYLRALNTDIEWR